MPEKVQTMNALVSDESVEHLLEYLFDDSPLSEQQKEGLRTEASGYKSDLCDQARVFEQTEQLDSYIALKFIDLKARWIVLNARIQDYNRNLTEPDPYLLYQSSILSGILGMLEEGLSESALHMINDTLANQASSLDSGPYVIIEGDQIIIEGKRKVMIYKRGKHS